MIRAVFACPKVSLVVEPSFCGSVGSWPTFALTRLKFCSGSNGFGRQWLSCGRICVCCSDRRWCQSLCFHSFKCAGTSSFTCKNCAITYWAPTLIGFVFVYKREDERHLKEQHNRPERLRLRMRFHQVSFEANELQIATGTSALMSHVFVVLHYPQAGSLCA